MVTMARTLKPAEYTYTDDLTKGDVPKDDLKEIRFTYKAQQYKIDLGPESSAKLDDALKPFLDAATKIGGGSGKAKSTTPARKDLPEVRAWARENGFTISARGRVPADALEAYDKAN